MPGLARGRIMLALLGFVWLAAIGVFATAALAIPQPLPEVEPKAPLVPSGPSAPLQDVPVLSRGSDAERAMTQAATFSSKSSMDTAIRAAWVAAFGPAAADQFMALVNVPARYHSEVVRDPAGTARYPFVFPDLEAFFDTALPAAWSQAQAQRASDLAAVLILTSVNQTEGFEAIYSDNGTLAYAILKRAARAPGCAPSVNLALLVGLDYNARFLSGLDTAFTEAIAKCPQDPTARWVFGHFLLGTKKFAAAVENATALQVLFPGSPWGYAGEADANLAEGAEIALKQPFTARAKFRRALELYIAAQRVSDDPGLRAAEAVAMTSLGDPKGALAKMEPAAKQTPRLALWHVNLLQRAGDFGRAAEIASTMPPRQPARVVVGQHSSVFLPEEHEPRPVLSVQASEAAVAQIGVGGGCDGCGAGSYVAEESVIPRFIDGTGVGYCLSCGWVEVRDRLLADDTSGALSLALRDEENSGSEYVTLSRAAAGELDLNDQQYQDLQNLWRFARRYDRAAAMAQLWVAASPDNPVPYLMSGEIAYLKGEFRSAETWFRGALMRVNDSEPQEEPTQCGADCRGRLWLRIGLAQMRQDNPEAAVGSLQSARESLTKPGEPFEPVPQSTFTDAYETYLAALGQLGLAQAISRDYAGSAHTLDGLTKFAAREAANEDGLGLPPAYRPGTDLNNLAISLIKSDRAREALGPAEQAIAADPGNPVFLASLAWAHQELSEWDAASAAYTKALNADPSFYPAGNDMAVALAESGRTDEAVDLLRRLVSVQPGYAPAWFNLGVALRERGPREFLAAENAFAHAISLDGSLRNHDQEFLLDADPYVVYVNSAELLPATWSFAGEAQRRPLALTAVLLVALLLRLAWQLGRELLTGRATEYALGSNLRLRREIRLPAIAGIVATVALVAWSVNSETGSWFILTVSSVAALGFLLVCAAARRSVALPSGVTMREFTGLPALVLSAAVGWYSAIVFPAPAATAQGPETAPSRLHLAAPAAMAALAAVLLATSRFTGLPLMRTLGALALGYFGSLVLPVRPYDGAFIKAKWLQYGVSVGAIIIAAVMFLGWL